jgi:hypothetical protein
MKSYKFMVFGEYLMLYLIQRNNIFSRKDFREIKEDSLISIGQKGDLQDISDINERVKASYMKSKKEIYKIYLI